MYDGVVTIADDDIPVIVEIDDEHVRMSAAGTEIGEWATEECQIRHLAESTYSIQAENETLTFVPNQPSLFAVAVNGPAERPTHVALPPEPTPESPSGPRGQREAPPPQPITMGLFYGLCVLTAALAIWSLISIAF
jgi:hypothetical protein